MKTYEITGFPTDNLERGVESLVRVLSNLSSGAEKLCIEAHFSDLTTLRTLAEVLPASRYELYGWCEIESGQYFERPEFASVRSARCIFGNRFLTVSEDTNKPPYDWNGLPSGKSIVGYWERFNEPVEKHQREADPAIIEDLQKIAASLLQQTPTLRPTTCRTDEYREQVYYLICDTARVAALLNGLSHYLKLQQGIGTFEFVGTAEALTQIVESGRYRLEAFPAGCWSFSDHKTPFALERDSFLSPILNLTASELSKVAKLFDALQRKVVTCSVKRGYLSWKLTNGATRYTQGNYILLSKQKYGGYALFVGYDQYSDDDPRPKDFLSAASNALAQLGAKIKAVPYPC